MKSAPNFIDGGPDHSQAQRFGGLATKSANSCHPDAPVAAFIIQQSSVELGLELFDPRGGHQGRRAAPRKGLFVGDGV